MEEGERAASQRPEHKAHQSQDHYKRSDSGDRNLIQMTVRFRKKTVDTMRAVAETEGIHLSQAFRLSMAVLIEDPENPKELILGILEELTENDSEAEGDITDEV